MCELTPPNTADILIHFLQRHTPHTEPSAPCGCGGEEAEVQGGDAASGVVQHVVPVPALLHHVGLLHQLMHLRARAAPYSLRGQACKLPCLACPSPHPHRHACIWGLSKRPWRPNISDDCIAIPSLDCEGEIVSSNLARTSRYRCCTASTAVQRWVQKISPGAAQRRGPPGAARRGPPARPAAPPPSAAPAVHAARGNGMLTT